MTALALYTQSWLPNLRLVQHGGVFVAAPSALLIPSIQHFGWAFQIPHYLQFKSEGCHLDHHVPEQLSISALTSLQSPGNVWKDVVTE